MSWAAAQRSELAEQLGVPIVWLQPWQAPKKSCRGTEVAATLYTVLETLKLSGKDPAAYLHAAIMAADRGSVLLPWQFNAAS